MALATKCPHCGTMFRVASDQLKLRGGIVRCGACQEIFDGSAALVDLDKLPASAPASPKPHVPEAAPAALPASAPVAAEAVPVADAAPQEAAAAPADTQAAGPIDEPVPVVAEAAPAPVETDVLPFILVEPEGADEADTPVDAASETPGGEELPVYTLDFDHTFDPYGILPKAAVTDVMAKQAVAEAAPEPASREASDESEPTAAQDAPEAAILPAADLEAATAEAEPAAALADTASAAEADTVADEATALPAAVAHDAASDAPAAPAEDAPASDAAPPLDIPLPAAEPPAEHPGDVAEAPAQPDQAPAAADPAGAAAAPAPADDVQVPAEALADAGAVAAHAAEAPVHAPSAATTAGDAQGRIEPVFDLPVQEELVAQALPDHGAAQDSHPAPAVDDAALLLKRESPASASATAAAVAGAPSSRSAAARRAEKAAARRSKLTPTKIEPQPKLRAAEIDEPEFVKRGRQQEQSGRARKIAMLAGSALLLLLLVGQGAFTFRNALAARAPALKPALVSGCALLGCRVELPAQVEHLVIETGELTTLGGGAYSFTTELRNTGTALQAWPSLELALLDANDKPLVRRVFAPKDYLAAGTPLAAGMAPRTEQAIKLHFRVDNLKPFGYHIAVFYP